MTKMDVAGFVAELLPMYDLDFVRTRLERERRPYLLRPDVIQALERGQEVAVGRYPGVTQHMGLEVLERCSEEVLRAADADNTRELLLAVAYRNLRMVELGMLLDPTSQGVLVALLLTDDAQRDQRYWGDLRPARRAAERMVNHLRLTTPFFPARTRP